MKLKNTVNTLHRNKLIIVNVKQLLLLFLVHNIMYYSTQLNLHHLLPSNRWHNGGTSYTTFNHCICFTTDTNVAYSVNTSYLLTI